MAVSKEPVDELFWRMMASSNEHPITPLGCLTETRQAGPMAEIAASASCKVGSNDGFFALSGVFG